MDLRGWDYTGRNIGPDLHRQFRIMIECLSDKSFTNHASWGNLIQDQLAAKMNVSSSGAVRTVKRVCVNFGLIVKDSFSSKNEIRSDNLLTPRGQLVYLAVRLERQISESTNYSEETKKQAYAQIKNLYEEAYCNALEYYHFTNSDGTKLHPLRATLKALQKYGKLDKWEWYLLNTFVRHDDNVTEEQVLDFYIKKYRDGEMEFTMSNVIEKPKGHQYIP